MEELVRRIYISQSSKEYFLWKQEISRIKRKNKEKFVRYTEGTKIYCMGLTKFQQLAKDAKVDIDPDRWF